MSVSEVGQPIGLVCLGPEPASGAHNEHGRTGPHAQRGATLGLMLWFYSLEIINNFLTGALHFRFALSAASYIVSPSWTEEFPRI